MNSEVKEEEEIVYQQDGDPKHLAQIVKESFLRNGCQYKNFKNAMPSAKLRFESDGIC